MRQTVIPNRKTSRHSTILAAIDGSGCSLNAGEHAVYLAKSLGAKLVVLKIIDTKAAFRAGIHYGRIVAELRKDCEFVVEKIEAMRAENGVAWEELAARGKLHRAVSGRQTTGPAQRPLLEVAIRVEDGEVVRV